MISADAVEAAEREFKVGVKRLVISALENPLFQERLRLARARTDFPGPDALTVAMDMEDFMTGIATEMIKLLNIPLPKGIHDELTAEGYVAFTTVDAMFNARLQRFPYREAWHKEGRPRGQAWGQPPSQIWAVRRTPGGGTPGVGTDSSLTCLRLCVVGCRCSCGTSLYYTRIKGSPFSVENH